ncbi:hypothetical protein HDU85_002535 [Gaertneriomyces sp. JEL0708]|nr:hypothetical protein HDU85_002535 [Gaertneriomyces sp. JEL0708]
MEIHDFTYIFVLGLVLAFADAFGIGANDVANSFSPSVAARSLTLLQACSIALFTEFGGAVLLGSSTTDTIKNGIIDLKNFDGNPGLLMLAFACALAGSSFWVITASRFGAPVSTTHSIVGAIAGVGVAAFGGSSVKWGWNGFGKIVASWFISPAVAGTVSATIYLITKYGILRSPNSLRRGINAIPIYAGVTLTVCVFYIVYKGGKSDSLTGNTGALLGIVFGIGAFITLFAFFFVRPFFIRRLINEESLRWYHVFYVPFLPPRPIDPHVSAKIAGTYTDHNPVEKPADVETAKAKGEVFIEDVNITPDATLVALDKQDTSPTLFSKAKKLLLKNITRDVVTADNKRIQEVHEHAVKFDSKTEYLYSALQVCTASFASFAHGSNDVANAVGPLAAIFHIWQTAEIPGKKSDVPIWILVFGGIAIDVGLITMGYRVMKNLGNNITYHSPSRGFAMELGAALTVVSASFIGLPVSTTHCITGSTVFVGFCNGTAKALNWKMISWMLFSWILTVPVSGAVAGLLFALIANAPRAI